MEVYLQKQGASYGDLIMNGKPEVLCDDDASSCLSSAAVCSTEQINTARENNNLIDGHVSLSQTVKLLLFAPFVLFETASDKLSPQGHFLGCNQPWCSLCPTGVEPTVTLLLKFFTLKPCPTDTHNVLSLDRQIVVFECGVIHKDQPLWSFFVLQLTII